MKPVSHKTSIRRTLLSSFMLLVILPLFMLMAYVIRDMSATRVETEKNSYMEAYQQMLQSLGNYFDRCVHTAQSLQVDSRLTNYLAREYPIGTTLQKRYADANSMLQLYQTRLLYESISGCTYSFFSDNTDIIYMGHPFHNLTEKDRQTDWFIRSAENYTSFIVSAPTSSEGYKMIPLSIRISNSKSDYTCILLLEIRSQILSDLMTVNGNNITYQLVNDEGILLASSDGTSVVVAVDGENTRKLTDFVARRQVMENNRLIVVDQVGDVSYLKNCFLVGLYNVQPEVASIRAVFEKFAPVWFIIMAVDIILILIFSHNFSGRISLLEKSARRVMLDEVSSTLILPGHDEVAELSRHIHSMVDHIDSLNRNIYQSQLQSKNAEIRALQSQINPHFLFNCLQAINASAMKNSDFDTSDMIVSYSRLIRRSIEWKDLIVPLREELNLIRDYLKIQSYRFGTRFRYEIDVDDEYQGIPVPKFSLQPLVENSMVHGVECNTGEVSLFITASVTNDRLLIKIRDTGNGIDEDRLQYILDSLSQNAFAPTDAHIGILNVHHRICLLYGPEYGVTVSSKVGEGTLVVITLPLRMRSVPSATP